MSRSRSTSIAIVLGLLVGLLVQASLASAGTDNMLKAETMVGVPPAFTGTANAAKIRDVPGGGIHWTIADSKVVLTADGHLTVKVQGLVLAAGDSAGSNPISSFRAIVSCLRSDATVANVTTDAFAATTGAAASGGGNAKFEGDVTLPSPCIAPIVLVSSPTGAWFASTGG